MSDPACLRVTRPRPERTALVTATGSVSHGRLEHWVQRLTDALRGAGAGPGRLVGVVAAEGAGPVAALLATLRAGATYVRLEPGTPPPADVCCVVGPGGLSWGAVPGTADPAPAGGTTTVLGGDLDDDVFTGPGGTLRGRSLRAYLSWALPAYPSAAGVAAVPELPATPMELTALLLPLLAGGTVHLGRPAPAPTFVKVPATALTAAFAGPLAGTLVVSGPRLPRDTVADWRRRHPRTELVWEYAPSAGEIGCAARRMPAGEALPDVVPLGLPQPGTTLHLMDPHLRPAALGDVGELYLGGEAVPVPGPGEPPARGIVLAPTGAWLRRTGDLGRRRPEGCVDLVGRATDGAQTARYATVARNTGGVSVPRWQGTAIAC